MLFSSIVAQQKAKQTDEASDDGIKSPSDPSPKHSSEKSDDDFITLPLTTKELVHGLFDGYDCDVPRQWTIASIILANLTTLMIALSVTVFAVSTLPHYVEGDATSLDIVEAVCIAYFIIEFLVRWVSAPTQKQFWSSVLTWIDLLTILPYFVYLGIKDSTNESETAALVSVRVLRLVRVVRVMKLFKQNAGFDAVFEAFTSSSDALSLMLFMLVITVTTFSACIYFAELQHCNFDEKKKRWIRPDGTVNPFQSIFHAMWWCVVTVTTVGYGDEVPVTGIGKAIASFTAIMGVFVISFPTAILGANFADIHTRTKNQRRKFEQTSALMAPKPGASPQSAMKRTASMKFHSGIKKINSMLQFKKLSKDVSDSPPQEESMEEKKEVPQPKNPLRSKASGDNLTMSQLGTETKLTYKIDQRYPPRELVVIDTPDEITGEPTATLVRYGPALFLQTASGDPADPMLLLRVEEIPDTSGKYFQLRLLLDHPNVRGAVEASLVENGLQVKDYTLIEPRPVSQLKVSMIPPPHLQDTFYLSTSEFNRPMGFVTLLIYVDGKDSERILLRNIGGFSFHFTVTYEMPSVFDIPASTYHASRMRRVSHNKMEVAASPLERSLQPVNSLLNAPSMEENTHSLSTSQK